MQAAATIRNREFTFDPAAPIEVLRAGEFPHSSGVTQVVDSLALESVLANFSKDKQSPNWPGLLVDFDHFSADMNKPSEAAGWIQDLRREGNSLLAVVDWTGAGDQAVRSGRYRLLSPVFNREEMQDLGNGRLRPVRLDSAGLTNSPNMRGLTPISNRSEPENVATLTPQQAGERCLALANCFKGEHGVSFEQAWQHVRTEAPALFNRMSPAAEAPRSKRSEAPGAAFVQHACNALSLLAEREKTAHGIPFGEAWTRVCNRRTDLVRLSNRQPKTDEQATLPPDADWREMERKAFDAFTSSLQFGPDGKLLRFETPEQHRMYFLRDYQGMERRNPNLTPREIWDQLKETEPHIFWPFVAVTAQ